MKILHICIGNYFNDKYSYQENMLTKYHKLLGYDVSVIAGLDVFNENGEIEFLTDAKKYINEYEIQVTRLNLKKNNKLFKKLKYYQGLYQEISQQKPDVIFIHNCQFICIFDVIKYLKQSPNTKVFVDNHADFQNSASNWCSKFFLHGILWRYCAKKLEPYVTKFYGVLPARVDFLKKVYNLPEKKVELLVMGADDEKISKPPKNIKEELGISNEFVIITGGKIDHNKPEILELMRAVINMENINVKLLVFGTVISDLKTDFDNLCSSSKIVYLGWQHPDDIYKFLTISNLAAFPGKHSVLWEQSVGVGIPCIFRRIDGFTHIDIGGNCRFFTGLSEQKIKEDLLQIVENKKLYDDLKANAQKEQKNDFLYSVISKKSIKE